MDGQTAARQRAKVYLTPGSLQIHTERGETIGWPWKEIRQARNYYGDGQMRLEKGGNPPEVLLVPGPLFLSRLKEVVPEEKSQFREPFRRKRWPVIAFLSAVGVIGASSALYLWGIPGLVSLVEPYVPVSWEEHLGQAVVTHLAPQEKQCPDLARTQRVGEILTILTSSPVKPAYTFRVIVVNQPAINAFAVPGGTIVILRGLLEKTQSAEELAGVLAHEMQHIIHRHATRALLQQASLRLLLAAMVGDAGTVMAFGVEGAQTIGMLHYTRQKEEEADREGIKMLMAAGVDPQGMIRFFEKMQNESEKSLKLPAYLSTHPDLNDRIQRLKSLAADSQPPSVKLLQDYAWKDIYRLCEATPPAH